MFANIGHFSDPWYPLRSLFAGCLLVCTAMCAGFTFVGFKLFLILLELLKDLLRSILLLVFGSSPAWLAPLSYLPPPPTNVVALSLGEKAGWDDRYEVDEADLFNLGELPPPPAPKPPPRVATKRRTLDREIAKSAGILGALASNGEMASIFGSGGLGMGAPTLNEELGGAIGGLIAAKGTQFGSAGLGSRGSGLGGGGTAEGLGGLGTKGRGSGSSGYGSGFARTGSSANTSDPTIIGSLDRSLFDAVIKRHMHQIRYCYERELTPNPSLSGKITIKFVVAKDGSVSKASVKTNTMGNQAVGECVVSRFERMQFPQPKGGGIVIVSYPLVFQRQ